MPIIKDELFKAFEEASDGDAVLRKKLMEEYRMAEAQKHARMAAMQQAGQNAHIYGGGGGGGLFGAAPAMQSYSGGAQSTAPRGYSPMEKLMTRLDVRHGSELPFEYIYAHVCQQKDNVVVFLIKNGEPIVLTDEIPLFPSDSLIGKLNLLRG